jgi:tripartite-type tricarboxylate transporter receptor subunit TctC
MDEATMTSKKTLIALAAAAMLAAPALADTFPGKRPIEITVLFPAGSSADVSARLLADGMSKRLGVKVFVVNRPGAGGAIGYRYAASQKPDGHSLVWNSNSISTTYYAGTLPFTYVRFDPVAQVLVESPVLAVAKDSPWKTLADVIAAAKAKPATVTVANSGAGSHTHISAVALFKTAKADVVNVPFGAAQLVPALLGHQIDAALQLPAALTGYVRTGDLRLLATLTDKRDPAFPDVPTAREQGINVSLEAWRGIAVPRGTPKKVVAQLETAIRETVASPEFKEGCERLGARPAFASSAEFGRTIARQDVQLARLMEAIGLNTRGGKHAEAEPGQAAAEHHADAEPHHAVHERRATFVQRIWRKPDFQTAQSSR